MKSNARIELYIIKCRTLCESPEDNWFKIGDVVQVSKIDHRVFFAFFRVDLVQILHGVKNGPSSIRSCRTRQH